MLGRLSFVLHQFINLQLQEARVYLDLVKETFKSTRKVVVNLLKILKKFKLKRLIDIQTITSISLDFNIDFFLN